MGREEAMKLIRPTQSIVLETFLPKILTPPSFSAEECHVAERKP